MDKKNFAIDILKCIAALLITNSHLDIFYPSFFKQFATGGAIGDVLFFFCSGFVLFLGRIDRFDNWYKRRINRIYPTVFCFLVLQSVILAINFGWNEIIIVQWAWFIPCIMIYYLIIYFIIKYFSKQFYLFYLITILITIGCFLFSDRINTLFIYKDTYLKWVFYFLFMLLGAQMGTKQLKYNFVKDSIGLILSLILFYFIQYLGTVSVIFNYLQLLTIIPLLSCVYYFYKVFSNLRVLNSLKKSVLSRFIKITSALTLEIYIVQMVLILKIPINYNFLFPLNVFFVFGLIYLSAFLLKITTNLFSQTFNEKNYSWIDIVRLYKNS